MTKEQHESMLTRRAFLGFGATAAALAGVALTGCAGSSEGTSSAASSAASEAAASEAAAEAAPTQLKASFSSSSTNYSPIGLNGCAALTLSATYHVFEGLYDLDLHTYEPYCALAASYPTQVSDLSYEIPLRAGAKFSNGSDVTAEDVANAIMASMANETTGPMLSFIAAVAAKDATTVAMTLHHPMVDLLEKRLALAKVFPASMSAEELAEWPIGSGPWMYEKLDGDDEGEISFLPNPHYNGMYPAGADSMLWTVQPDNNARVAALEEGRAAVIDSVPNDSSNHLVKDGLTVNYKQGFSQAFLMFNCLKPPFDDKRVRQAFFYAIDAKKLIKNALDGHGSPVRSFLPQGHSNYHEASTVFSYNPDRARELLAEANLTAFEFTMTTNNNWVKDLAAQIQSDLAAVGITMINNEQNIAWQDFNPSEDILPYDVMLCAGDPSQIGDDPDLLMSWWYGDNVWTRGRSCWALAPESRFAELQELMKRARETDGREQQLIWNECFNLIADEAPLYALFHRQLSTAYQEKSIGAFEPVSAPGLWLMGAYAK